jgi:hypothetical protein
MEYASGVVAAPTSPIPPALASGAISKNGTAVEMTLDPSLGSGGSWANKLEAKIIKTNDKTSLFLICNIRKILMVTTK